MPDKVDEENVDPQVSKTAEGDQAEGTRLKGVSWQDGVDGKSLFTVRCTSPCSSFSYVR